MFELGRHQGGDRLRFATRSGILSVLRSGRSEGEQLALDLPVSEWEAVQAPAGLSEALDCPVVRVAAGTGARAGTGGSSESAACGSTDLLVELADEGAVAALEPDLGLLGRLDHRAVLVTAAADADDVDYVLRVFGPRVGIPEDPATGSAHCLLAPWWAGRLGRDHLEARQLSARGAGFGVRLRPGVVEVGGSAVTVVRGTVEPVDDGSPG